MPQNVDLGPGYGVVAFPDDYTPDQILAEYNSLEEKRSRDIRRQKLLNARQADINTAQQESHIPENIALGVEAGIGAAPLAAGHVLGALVPTRADIEASGQRAPESFTNETLSPGVGGFPINLGLNAPTLRYFGKALVDYGNKKQQAAREEAEQLGGGVAGNIARSLAETATVSSETLPFALFGMGPVSVAAGLQQYGLQKEQFKQQLQQRNPGLSDEEAYRIADGPAALTGAVTAGLTRIFGGTERLINRIVEGQLKAGGVKALLREANIAGGTELPEEYLDQLSQGFVEKAYINPDKPVSEIFNEAGMAGLAGYTLGVGHGAAIQAPLHAASAVQGAVEESRLRRESREQSRERIRRVIAQRESEQNAESLRTIPPAPGEEARAGEETAGGVRVRNPAQNRVETIAGEEVANAPPIPTPPVAAGNVEPAVTPSAVETPPARPVAVFAGYQFGMADHPTYQIPGARPGILRNVNAEGARAAGYDVPASIPTFEEWQAGQTVSVPGQTVSAPPPLTPQPPVVQEAIDKEFTPQPKEAPMAFVGRVVRDVIGRWENAPDIQLVDNWGQLPDDVRATAEAQGTNPNTIDAVRDSRGTVWIVSSKVKDAAHARRLLLHEAVGHEGVDRAFGDLNQWTTFMQGVAQRHANTALGAEIRGLYGNDPATVGKEIVARLAETPQADPTLWQRIIAAIRTWARRVFKVDVSDNDIRVLLRRGREAVQARSGTIGRTTYFLESGGRILPAKNATVVGPAAFAITAHHGTRHKVDRFKIEKVGTGEGNQTYGWGLYFAEEPNVAKAYADRLGGGVDIAIDGVRQPDLQVVQDPTYNPRSYGAWTVVTHGGNVDEAVRALESASRGKWIEDYEVAAFQAAAEFAKTLRGKKVAAVSRGNQYTVTLNADPEEFLDWDKPAQQQPKAIQELIIRRNPDWWNKNYVGSDLYHLIVSDETGPKPFGAYNKLASERLRDVGVKGIRYLDAGSRFPAIKGRIEVKSDYLGPALLPGERELVDRFGHLPVKETSSDGRNYVLTDSQEEHDAWIEWHKARGEFIREVNRPEFQNQTYNYVVFDDRYITITHENGQPVPVREAMGGTSFSLQRPPPISGLQVAGAAAEVGHIAENIYKTREAGGQQLEGLAYQRKQFQMARAELKRLADIAYGRFGASAQTEEPIIFPDPTEGVGIEEGRIAVSDAFSNTLNAAGVDHDIGNVKAMQAEIFFEGAAKRLNNLEDQITTLMTARQYYTELGVSSVEIEKIDKLIQRLSAQDDALSGAFHRNRNETVGGRASEIRANETLRPERMAQKDSLSLRPVAQFFGRQVGGYRDFIERAGVAAQLAQALRHAATDPAEIARLTTEAQSWLTLPQDVQAAILSGLPLTDEQRAAAFSSLALVFDDFDSSRARMNEIAAARIPEIDKEERELFKKMAEFKVTSGMQEVMIADVLAALDGESGGTGTLQSQAVTQELRQRISAIQSFALAIGTNLETNKALFEWLANPTTDLTLPIGVAYGVDAQTLSMILNEVRRNPSFGSAIVTLVEASNKKLASLPVVQLEQIKALVDAGNEDGARVLANRIMQRANARASVAESGLRETLRKIDDLNIERKALGHGIAMFDELAATPEFKAVRDAVSNSPYGLVEPMVAQNNTDTTFKPFGAKGIPSHEGLVLGAKDDFVLKSAWFHKVDQWHLAAQQHLDAYAAALAAHNADPLTSPQPSALGFDLPKVRGLRDATKRHVPGSFLELSLLSENKRWKVPRLIRVLSKLAWFRQHDFVSKMVGGIAGTDLRGRLADFTNHFLIARSIIQKYSDIPDLLHAAMKSHPAVQMNMANYRTIWNELAHWGRIFGSPVRIGFVLPLSNTAVTAEDIALLKRQGDFEEELRRRVTETNPTAGIRQQVGGRELVRSAAAVGDYGLPRHLNRTADAFIADVLKAYAGDPVPFFDPTTDLSATTTNPVVAFWNNNMKLLLQHVLDVRRGDRSMSLTPAMQAIETASEAQWRSLGTPALHSVEELVNELLRNAPPMPGVNIRDTIIHGLNAEVRQYFDHARRIANERAERDQERNSGVRIAFSADNEFTRPAAKLDLPSALYDYGALTPGEHMTVTSRANHERVVAYAMAVNRAIAEMQGRLDRMRAGEITPQQAASSYGGDIDEMKQVLGILRAVGADFEAAYRTGNPTLSQSRWYREGFGLITSGVLALPPVGLRNMTQGQFETYIMSRAMGLSGQRLTMWRALKAMVKTVARAATDTGMAVMRHTDLGLSLLTGKNVQLFSKLADIISDLLLSPNYLAGAQRVHELGYDTREAFLSRLSRVWEETEETITPEDLSKLKIKGRTVTGLAAVPSKVLRAFFDKIGVQQYDQAINATLLTYATWLQKRMEEVALTYGAERARQGLTRFDPMDRRWDLQPDEFSAFKSEQQNKDALGLFRLFLEGSANPEGFQLERNMWEFYQKHQAGQHPSLFTPRQFDAVQRKLIAEFNASTPANRASAAAGNNVIRNLLTLQGYVSDGLLKMINHVAGGSRDRTYLAATLGKLPAVALLAIMGTLISYFAGSLTGEWEKRIRGRMPTLATPLDKDFWTSFKRWRQGTASLLLSQLFYLGDIILMIRGEIMGNRGFDPAGKIFPVSIVQRGLAAVRGLYNTARGTGNIKDAIQPIADVGRSMVPYWAEVEHLFGLTQGVVKQGQRIIMGEAQVRGLLPDSRQSVGGPSYGPTTIIRRNLGDAVSGYYTATQAGNTGAAESALTNARAQMAKLENFYVQKYLKAGDSEADAHTKAQRDVWNDYQEINPVVAGMGGKRPTAAQWELIRNGMSGERAAVVDAAVAAWQAGAQALFGRQGNITREDVGAARGGGTGGRVSTASRAVGIDGRPLAGLRGGGGIGGIRTVGLGIPSGIRRPRGTGTSRLRRSVTGAIRGTTRRRLGPRIRRATSSRRTPLIGRRRRPAYSVA